MKGARSWKMKKPCADCPFDNSVKGKHLRRSLAPGRMASIKRDLMRDAAFFCHKTTDETGDGSKLLCAGALAWQESKGVSSNYQRVCENLDWIARRRAEREARP